MKSMFSHQYHEVSFQFIEKYSSSEAYQDFYDIFVIFVLFFGIWHLRGNIRKITNQFIDDFPLKRADDARLAKSALLSTYPNH